MPHQPRVLVSQVIPGSPDDVWKTIREFDSLDEWGPLEECTIEGDHDPDQLGAVRTFQAGDRTVREELVALSDEDRFYQYTIVEGGGGKVDYVSELRLIPITETGETLARQHAHFDVEGVELDEAKAHLEDVFAGALNSLREQYS
ncbi:SRPBCC family protein [Halobacteria archaeon AArc-dxtr1]|nr:SRPBCC family protein [Halobacteria archaeon AArc-dxtr1]